MRCHPLAFGYSGATRNEDVLRYRRKVEVEREFPAGVRALEGSERAYFNAPRDADE